MSDLADRIEQAEGPSRDLARSGWECPRCRRFGCPGIPECPCPPRRSMTIYSVGEAE